MDHVKHATNEFDTADNVSTAAAVTDVAQGAVTRRADSIESVKSHRENAKIVTKYDENMHLESPRLSHELLPLTGGSDVESKTATKSPPKRKKRWGKGSGKEYSRKQSSPKEKRRTQFVEMVEQVIKQEDKPTLMKVAEMIGHSMSIGSLDDLDLLNQDESCHKCEANEDAVTVKVINPCHDHTRDTAAEAKIVQAQQRSKASSGLLLVSSLLAAIASQLMTADTEAVGASDTGYSHTRDFQGVMRTASIITNMVCIALNLSSIVVLGLHDYLLQRTLSTMVDDPEYCGGLALLFMDNGQVRGLRTRAFFCTVYSLPTLMLGSVLHAAASAKESTAAWVSMAVGGVTIAYMFYSIWIMMAQKGTQKEANKKRKITNANKKKMKNRQNTHKAFELKKEGYKDRLVDAATTKARSRANTMNVVGYKESAERARADVARLPSLGKEL